MWPCARQHGAAATWRGADAGLHAGGDPGDHQRPGRVVFLGREIVGLEKGS